MSTNLLHLGGQSRLDGPTVLGLAAALVVLGGGAVVMAMRHGGAELTWLLMIVWLTCLGGIVSAGAWSAVTLDATKRQVASRIGFLGLGAPVATSVFADYVAVVVCLERQSASEAVTTPGSGFYKTASRTRTTHSYALRLKGRVGDLVLPLRGDGKGPDEAEALAAQVARLGGWPMRRRGYVRDRDSGAPTSRGVAFDAESPIAAHATRAQGVVIR